MRFEWDEEKEKLNLAKHRITFSTASLVFGDPKAIFMTDPDHSEDEFREIALGKVGNLTILVVIFVDRTNNNDEIIRIISARQATLKEEAQYYSEQIH